MTVHLSSWIRRVRLLGVVARRVLAVVVGLGIILALSGSQATLPLAAAQGRTRSPSEGSLDLTQNPAPTDSSSSDPAGPSGRLPVRALPTTSGTPAGPYGLTSTDQLTSSGIPQVAYQAYVNAAASLARTAPNCRITWPILAGIGRVESNHGRFGGSSLQSNGLDVPPVLGMLLDGSGSGTAKISDTDGGEWDGSAAYDRAVGPMQFLPGTWKVYGGGGNPENINDAALAAGRYLCANNASLATRDGQWAAVYRYNHSDSYVSLVLSLAAAYASGQSSTFPTRPGGSAPPTPGPPATTPGPPPGVPTPPPSTPTPTASTSTATATVTFTKWPTARPTVTVTVTATPTGSSTATPTGSPTVTPTGSPTAPPTTTTAPPTSDSPPPTSDSPTVTVTVTSTSTSTSTPSSSSSESASCSASPTPTVTPTATSTITPSGTPTCGS